MYRTDTPMLRRINGDNIRGTPSILKTIPDWRKEEYIAGWAESQPWIMNKQHFVERALTLSYCDFSNKEVEENEWYKWFMELTEHDIDRVCLPNEWAFDEFVFSIKQKVELQTQVSQFGKQTVLTDNKEALMWAYINCTENQREGLEWANKEFELVDLYTDSEAVHYSINENLATAFVSLYISYANERTIYHWDGWFVPMYDQQLWKGGKIDASWRLIPTPLCQKYWEAEDTALREEYPHLQTNPLITGLTEAASTVAICATRMMTYLKYGPKHLVEVVPSKAAKKRKGDLTKNRPWLNATGPKVLLLDRMPSTQKEHQGGTHASPKPHRRRGHWKTLRHPKYRHHPKYLVENGIFIKPSFVGPKEAEHEGNIYKLVEPWPEDVA